MSSGIRVLGKLVLTSRESLRFPLTKAWADPATIDEWKKTGQFNKHKSRFYPLPKSARPTDGCLALGGTSDGSLVLLVLQGKFAGSIWVDSTGNDCGSVAPLTSEDIGVECDKQKDFCGWQRQWVQWQWGRQERLNELIAAAQHSQLAMLRDALITDNDRTAFDNDCGTAGRKLLNSADGKNHSIRRASISLLRMTDDQVDLDRALLKARAFDDLAAICIEVLASESHEVEHHRAFGHLVLAHAANNRIVDALAVNVPDDINYFGGPSEEVEEVWQSLSKKVQAQLIAHLPPSLGLAFAGDRELSSVQMADLASRLLRRAITGIHGENAARDATNEWVSGLDERTTRLTANALDALARLLAYVSNDEDKFDMLAKSSEHFPDGERARRLAIEWLLANQATLMKAAQAGANPSPYAVNRFAEIANVL
jgi:hypothetical protein